MTELQRETHRVGVGVAQAPSVIDQMPYARSRTAHGWSTVAVAACSWLLIAATAVLALVTATQR